MRTPIRYLLAGIFVPADSPIKGPEDLANVPISVGFQSGSHYSTIQALEPFLSHNEINLSFADGLLFKRMENLIDGAAPGRQPVQRALLFHGAIGLSKGARHIVHDGGNGCRGTLT